MNFLETLVCLTLVALLAGISVFGYQQLILRTQVESDTQLVKTALEEARAQGGSARCNNHDCLVVSAQGKRIIILSGENTVNTQLFPASSDNTFVFSPDGLTAFHNGTIHIFPEDKPKWGKKVIVSQGGRIR